MKWRFDASGTALRTVVGKQRDGRIEVSARIGCALYGPYLTVPAGSLRARILLAPGAKGMVTMDVIARGGQQRLATARMRIEGQRSIQQVVELDDDAEHLEVRLFCRGRTKMAIVGLELDLERDHSWTPPDVARPVGYESGKTLAQKVADGFFDRYLSGPAVMEVGYKGYNHSTVPIVAQAVGVDVGYPGYDGRRFPFADASLDAIYSSHCYEHIPDYRAVLRDWYRLLKVGGFLIIIVPHQHLFERKRYMPSRWNPDHQRFYTPRSLLGELEAALDENSYRVRHLVENDAGFDYGPTPREATDGCYEIELVIEKLAAPVWRLDDGSVRPYPAGEFSVTPRQTRVSPYETRLDLGETGHLVWGPYHHLLGGHYQADFFIDGEVAEAVDLVLEVARGTAPLATAHIRLMPGTDRHRFTLGFTNDEDDAFFEYRIANWVASSAGVSFRGVELRHVAAAPDA